MSELSIKLYWQRSEPELRFQHYSNAHTIEYTDRYSLPGDAPPDWGGHPDYTNPEQALAAAVSSCHMMTFLALAAKAKWPVASYHDRAVAYLGKNPKGQMSVTRIDLHPTVGFDSGFSASAKEMAEMQDRAHRYCFIANSLAEFVEVNVL